MSGVPIRVIEGMRVKVDRQEREVSNQFGRQGSGQLPIREFLWPTRQLQIIVWFYRLLGLCLVGCALFFFAWSWHWPLVGDASAIHYVAFLIRHGWTPYRDIIDQQFPGAYLIELAGMWIFGMSSLSWRIYDFTLLAFATISFFAVTRSTGALRNGVSGSPAPEQTWMPGLFSACLFILIHGRDGLEQGGQRDFAVAVLLLGATALLFVAVRRNSRLAAAAFGLLSGAAFAIKPTVLPLSFAQLIFACFVYSRRRVRWGPYFASSALGFLIAPAVSIEFLLRERAFGAFFSGFRNVVPYYASLGHRPLSYILVHSVSPVLLIVYIWLVCQIFRFTDYQPIRGLQDWERTTLLMSALFGLTDCIMQARALPYYRYPLLSFLLPLMAIDFDRAVKRGVLNRKLSGIGWRQKCTTALAVAALAFGGLVVAPQSAILIHRYRWWETDFISSLEQNLTALGGASLSRHILCIDSVSGCVTALYRMKLEPASGIPGDFLLFGPDSAPAVRMVRQRFRDDIFQHPPKVIVVSSHLHLDDAAAEDFRKLDRWPVLTDFLARDYTLATEWHPTRPALWWSRPITPADYRIYVLRSDARPFSSP